MKINKKISALLCSIAMCCSSGQVSKTSASVLGYFFSAAAVQQWLLAVSLYYSTFRSKVPTYCDYWFVNLVKPDENFKISAGEGFKQVAKSLSGLRNLYVPVVLTYLAREEFRKEKENNKRVSGEKTCVDSKNDKGKKDSNNKK